jgi:hypothetical protein
VNDTFPDIDTKAGMDFACKWTVDFLKMCSDRFTWGIPRSNAVYVIDQRKKTVTAQGTGRDVPVERVFKELGFEVR